MIPSPIAPRPVDGIDARIAVVVERFVDAALEARRRDGNVYDWSRALQLPLEADGDLLVRWDDA
jgi:hypothetical protein